MTTFDPDAGVYDVSDDRRILGYRYLYALGGPLFPALLVAKRGEANDWAAYAAGLWTNGPPTRADFEAVMAWGAKLTEQQARGFFPYIVGLEYRE